VLRRLREALSALSGPSSNDPSSSVGHDGSSEGVEAIEAGMILELEREQHERD
jgi:hypothetical protein